MCNDYAAPSFRLSPNPPNECHIYTYLYFLRFIHRSLQLYLVLCFLILPILVLSSDYD